MTRDVSKKPWDDPSWLKVVGDDLASDPQNWANKKYDGSKLALLEVRLLEVVRAAGGGLRKCPTCGQDAPFPPKKANP